MIERLLLDLLLERPCCGLTFFAHPPAGSYETSHCCVGGETFQMYWWMLRDWMFSMSHYLYYCYRGKQDTLWPSFWIGTQRPSWMNEWVGPDINVVGPLQIPPSDEFSMSESSHLFGKSALQEPAQWNMRVYRWVWSHSSAKCHRQHANTLTEALNTTKDHRNYSCSKWRDTF